MANSSIDRPKHPARTAKALCLKPLARLSALLRASFLDGSHWWSSKKGDGAGNRSRNIMRIRNLTRTGIILALGTERLYLEPTRKSPAIVRWTQNHDWHATHSNSVHPTNVCKSLSSRILHMLRGYPIQSQAPSSS